MYDTGVRVAELVRLRLEDVDVGAGQARIHGKNRFVDTVPLSNPLCEGLADYLQESRFGTQDSPASAFFTSRGGGPASTNAIRLWMRRTRIRAGLDGKRVSPHVVRASAATHFAAAGASAFGVQRFLRHRTASMSQRCVDVAALDLAQLHARASPFQRLIEPRPSFTLNDRNDTFAIGGSSIGPSTRTSRERLRSRANGCGTGISGGPGRLTPNREYRGRVCGPRSCSRGLVAKMIDPRPPPTDGNT